MGMQPDLTGMYTTTTISGQLLKLVNEAGKRDNTVVIYLSDNGIAFPGAKTTVYEPGIKLPLIVSDPRVPHREIENQAMVTWTDITPTILDFAEVDFQPGQFHGRSFRPILGVRSPDGWNTMYASHNFHELTMYYPMRVIRSGNFKLIWNVAYRLEYPFASDLWASSTWQSIHRKDEPYFGNRRVKDYLFRAEFELYNLLSDPHELTNLAESEQHGDRIETLKQKLKAFQRKTRDPWQIMWGNETQIQGTGVGL